MSEDKHINNIEEQVIELRKRSIDWRFLVSASIPVLLVIGSSLITIAINVSTMSERLNGLNANIASFNAHNARELDKLSTRLDRLEQKYNDRK